MLCRAAVFAAPPAFVDITWMSIANVYYELGPLSILTDGYITRLPRARSSAAAAALRRRASAFKPDVAAVTRVLNALGGAVEGESAADRPQPLRSLVRYRDLVEADRRAHHRVEDDLPAGAGRAASRRIGARPSMAARRLHSADGVTMRVVRWNHSGDPATNPEQHNPVELDAVPVPDPATGGLRAGVAEDFPNGGGNRAFLFIVDGPQGRFSWFFQNSASAVDLHVPIVDRWRGLRRADRESQGRDEGRGARRRSICGSAPAARPSRSWCCRCSSRKPTCRCTGTACGARSRPACRSRMPIPRSRRFSTSPACG